MGQRQLERRAEADRGYGLVEASHSAVQLAMWVSGDRTKSRLRPDWKKF